jgi:hypothetical protein
MSSLAVKTAVRARLAALWPSENAAIREPNTAFDPQGRPWIDIRFPGAAIGRADIGDAENPLWDEVGALMVDVYIPAGGGPDLGDALAEAVAAIFQGQEFDGVQCRNRLPGQSGERAPEGMQGAWWGVSFGIGYRFQSIGSP